MTVAPVAVAERHAVAGWRDVLVLLKLRIDALVVCVALAAAVAAGERSAARLGVLALATLAASGGAGALNHAFDRDLDRRMARTSRRPVADGRIDARAAFGLGFGLVASTVLAVPALGPASVGYLLAGAATYALVYTRWLKRRTPFSIVWGGAAGSFAVLAGWQLGAPALRPAPLLLAMVLFLWTPSHFWSFALARVDDYRAAGVPMLSVVAGVTRTARAVVANTVGLVVLALAYGAYAGWPYLAVAVPASAGFLLACERLAREPTTARAWTVFKLSGLYLLAVLVGVAVAATT